MAPKASPHLAPETTQPLLRWSDLATPTLNRFWVNMKMPSSRKRVMKPVLLHAKKCTEACDEKCTEACDENARKRVMKNAQKHVMKNARKHVMKNARKRVMKN